MDIVGLLPLEISQHILSFLNAEEISSCCLVSKRWRDIGNSDHLWYKLCLRGGIDVNEEKDQRFIEYDEKPPTLNPQCKWAQVYNLYFSLLVNNWSSSQCEKYDIPYGHRTPDHSTPRIFTDGKTIVISYSSGLVEIWKIKKGRRSIPSLHQSINTHGHSVYKVLIHAEFLVFVVDTIFVLVYQQFDEQVYRMTAAFYTRSITTNEDVRNRFVFKKDTETLEYFLSLRLSRAFKIYAAGLIDSCLYVKCCMDSVFLWSLHPFAFVNVIQFDCLSFGLLTIGGHLYVNGRSEISVYDKSCAKVKSYKLPERVFHPVFSHPGCSYITSVNSNDKLVSAIQGTHRELLEISRKLVVWDKASADLVWERDLLLYEYAFLHPHHNILYIIHQSVGSQHFIIKAWRPDGDRILWLGLHSCELDSYHFGSVGRRFILFFSQLNKNYVLFDFKSGEKRPLNLTENDSLVIEYSNDSLILTQSRALKTFTIFSFMN